ncbi:hypothetical protein EG329_007587 [Mollisiaceae sp. DMI_Dod_QoI]|nr:hypothetical protein EG329_007587 [Helotiales sp. DMI_Dod_QoI]
MWAHGTSADQTTNGDHASASPSSSEQSQSYPVQHSSDSILPSIELETNNPDEYLSPLASPNGTTDSLVSSESRSPTPPRTLVFFDDEDAQAYITMHYNLLNDMRNYSSRGASDLRIKMVRNLNYLEQPDMEGQRVAALFARYTMQVPAISDIPRLTIFMKQHLEILCSSFSSPYTTEESHRQFYANLLSEYIKLAMGVEAGVSPGGART